MISRQTKLSTLKRFLVNSSQRTRTIFGKACYFCGTLHHTPTPLCRGCFDDLPWLSNGCSVCGIELTSSASICSRCLKNRPVYQRCFAPMNYQFPLSSAILQLKEEKKRYHGRLLATIACQTFSPDLFCTAHSRVVPVPADPKRLKQRGFNPATEIALALGKRHKIPVSEHTLKKTRSTPAQHALTFQQRSQNLKGCFEVTRTLKGERVLLIDDVVTTGATVNLLSRHLLASGARSVDVFCIARTPLVQK